MYCFDVSISEVTTTTRDRMDSDDSLHSVVHESAEPAALLGCAHQRRSSLEWTALTKTSTSVSNCSDAAAKQRTLGVARQNVIQVR